MSPIDVRALASVGRALWADPRESQVATAETLSAIALQDLTQERALERAAAAMLDRVKSRGLAANTRSNLATERTASLTLPFYRLFPEERFLLVAIHVGRWSYARLSRIFGVPVETIEEMVWGARISLSYPAGAPASGPSCPVYDSKRPWTQRFLDDEQASGTDRLFLQNHLMACDSCRQALARCRDVYYAIDRTLPRLSDGAGDAAMLRDLERITRQGIGIKAPFERGFVESLSVFTRRADIRWAMALIGLLLALRIAK